MYWFASRNNLNCMEYWQELCHATRTQNNGSMLTGEFSVLLIAPRKPKEQQKAQHVDFAVKFSEARFWNLNIFGSEISLNTLLRGDTNVAKWIDKPGVRRNIQNIVISWECVHPQQIHLSHPRRLSAKPDLSKAVIISMYGPWRNIMRNMSFLRCLFQCRKCFINLFDMYSELTLKFADKSKLHHVVFGNETATRHCSSIWSCKKEMEFLTTYPVVRNSISTINTPDSDQLGTQIDITWIW